MQLHFQISKFSNYIILNRPIELNQLYPKNKVLVKNILLNLLGKHLRFVTPVFTAAKIGYFEL
jgi:hypothetical protein